MKERFKQFLDYLGIGQDKFEKKVGLSSGFVNKVGDSIRVKSQNKIKDTYPELNMVWLLTGEGKMLKDKNTISEPTVSYGCADCKRKDEEIKRLKIELDELKNKYIALLEEQRDKKVS